MRAAIAGCYFAQYMVGIYVYEGIAVVTNCASALVWFKKSANQNFAPAQHAAGQCLWLGEGCAQDYIAGMEYIKLAADQEYAPALCRLGLAHELGCGVVKDLNLTREYHTKAAALGCNLAKKQLARLHMIGQIEDGRNFLNSCSNEMALAVRVIIALLEYRLSKRVQDVQEDADCYSF